MRKLLHSLIVLAVLFPFHLSAQENCNCHSCCDGVDNDGNSYVDQDDLGCNGCSDCSTEQACSNGVDDDGDGDIDNADSNCPPGETACANGVDDDGDGQVDCNDPDCDADHSCCTPSNHVLSASGDGGFENGSSFSANGWTLNNDGATNDWVLGTAPSGYSGSRCAYISKDGGSSYEYDITDETHIDFSRSVDLSGYTGNHAIYLSFDWKGNCNDGCFDIMEVRVNGDPVTNVLINQTSWTNKKVELTSYAGSIIDLSFHWDCGFSNGSQAPHAVDNIEVYECISGCLVNASFTVNDSTQCVSGNSFDFTNTGSSSGFDHSWQFGDGQSSNLENPTHTYSDSGSYQVRLITDSSSSCADTAYRTVVVGTVATSLAPADTLSCSRTEDTLDASSSFAWPGNPSYSWSSSSGNIVSGSNTATAVIDDAGTYKLLLSEDSIGCVDSATIDVPIDTISPTISFSSTDTFKCGTDSMILDASGSSSNSGQKSYSWSTSNGSIDQGSNTATPEVESGGDYVLTLTDPVNGCSNTDTLTVPQDTALPNVVIAPTDTLDCNTSVVTIDASGSSTSTGNIDFGWSTSGGNIISAAPDSSTIDVDQGGSYTLTVTDTGNGCASSQGVTVIQDTALPVIDTTNLNISPVSCGDTNGAITGVQINGGTAPFYNVWTNSSGDTVQADTNVLDLDSLQVSDYQLMVTGANGCVDSSGPLNVPAQNAPSTDASALQVVDDTCGQGVGAIIGITVSGGSSPYTYVWDSAGTPIDTSSSTADIDSLSPGDHHLTVIDANGCTTSTGPFTVGTVPGPTLDSSNVMVQDASCLADDGMISGVVANGGSPGYSFTWWDSDGNMVDNSGSPAIADSLGGGTYSVVVTDANGCRDSLGAWTVQKEQGPNAAFTPDPTKGNPPLSVNFTDQSSGADFYDWYFGDGDSISSVQNPVHSYDSTGEYQVMLAVEDSSGCVDTAYYRFIIVEPKSKFKVPNVFSPNGDGKNDVFKVVGQNLDGVNGTIYNRWGQSIFKWDEIDEGWKGRNSSGKEVPEGTYFYDVKVRKRPGGKLHKIQGSVTLLR